MTDIIVQVKEQLLEAIDNDKVQLPTLPEVALKIREEAQSDNVTIDRFTKLLATDVALSARVIKVANSPLLRAAMPAENLRSAVSRLGITYSCNLATSLAMKQMFQATSDAIDKKMREVWEKSSDVAGICHVLAKHYTNLAPDAAALAGLIHRIGVLPILTFAEDHHELLNNSMILDNVIDAVHPALGNKILEKWGFAEELITIPTDHLDFTAKKETTDFSDIVTVAYLQSHLGTEHPLTKLDWSKVTAFERLGLDPDFEDKEGEDLSEEMEAAMRLLK